MGAGIQRVEGEVGEGSSCHCLSPSLGVKGQEGPTMRKKKGRN